jgi:hypothetical protein
VVTSVVGGFVQTVHPRVHWDYTHDPKKYIDDSRSHRTSVIEGTHNRFGGGGGAKGGKGKGKSKSKGGSFEVADSTQILGVTNQAYCI